MVKTYVLAGSGVDLEERIAAWQERSDTKGDVVVLRPESGQTMKDLVGRIQGPANIFIEAHGGQEGVFLWNKDQVIRYSELFKALPRDGSIQSITVDGCYGESAISMLGDVPMGTIVQSRIGSKVQGMRGPGTRMIKELLSYDKITSLSMMLEALDNTNPAVYKTINEENNAFAAKQPDKAKADNIVPISLDPRDVLPHTIGVGGLPPIDLNIKMAEISAAGKSNTLNRQQFTAAIEQVKKHFDTENGGYVESPVEWLGRKTGLYGLKKELDKKIEDVAKKLEFGADTKSFTLEEVRIGYALTIANLYETGEMDRLVSKAKQTQAGATHDVKPNILAVLRGAKVVPSSQTQVSGGEHVSEATLDTSTKSRPKHNQPYGMYNLH